MRRLWRVLPVVAWSTAIWFVSAMPHPPAIPAGASDKVAHAAAYGIHSGAAWIALPGGRKWRALGAVAIAAAWGALDEYHQSFVPNRSADVHDWVADAIGAVAVVTLLATFDRWHERGTA